MGKSFPSTFGGGTFTLDELRQELERAALAPQGEDEFTSRGVKPEPLMGPEYALLITGSLTP